MCFTQEFIILRMVVFKKLLDTYEMKTHCVVSVGKEEKVPQTCTE